MSRLDALIQDIQKAIDLSDTEPFFKNTALEQDLTSLIQSVNDSQEDSFNTFHRMLAHLNNIRLSPNSAHTALQEVALDQLCTLLEEIWLQLQQNKIKPYLEVVPTEVNAFIEWIESLQTLFSGDKHSLFLYLAERANLTEMRYFIHQEAASEAGFDDLLSMVQIKTSPVVKQELAHNYWDEMGEGELDGMHTLQFRRLIKSFDLSWDHYYQDVHWAPLALSNLMIAFASKRSRFNQAIGALGAIELTSPLRCLKVMEGLRRLGLSSYDYNYYTLHATLDVTHWNGWKNRVIVPLVTENPAYCKLIAEGALMRLIAGEYCFKAYMHHLGLEELMPDELQMLDRQLRCVTGTNTNR